MRKKANTIRPYGWMMRKNMILVVGANRIRPIKQKQCIAIYSRLYRNRNDMNEPKS